MASVGDKYKCCDELFAALQDKYREDLVAVPIILFGGTDLLFREQGDGFLLHPFPAGNNAGADVRRTSARRTCHLSYNPSYN